LGRQWIVDGRLVGERVDADDVGSFFGQADGVAAALAPGYAGDEGDAPVERSHVSSSVDVEL
jgi:hypothetical protein